LAESVDVDAPDIQWSEDSDVQENSTILKGSEFKIRAKIIDQSPLSKISAKLTFEDGRIQYLENNSGNDDAFSDYLTFSDFPKYKTAKLTFEAVDAFGNKKTQEVSFQKVK
ncbi:MAG: hypothetical protein IT215_05930, partial [Chitinophagaceae bacterium]|nr:hypothetical protein [Chitinophagaceae bacterium]